MSYILKWTFLASESYFDEIEFIYKKWNLKEVNKFESLVASELERLSLNPKIGKLQASKNYSLVISKQTTIIYRINDNLKAVELLLFWNNLKNPSDLTKLL